MHPEAVDLSAEETLTTFGGYLRAAVPFALCNSEHRYIAVNEALAALNGVPASNHPGKKPADVHPELGQKIEPILRGVAKSARPALDVPIRASVSETHREWLLSAYPVGGAGPARTAHILLDTTEYKHWQRLLGCPLACDSDHDGWRSAANRLTRREIEVLEWIGQGKTSKEIAAGLGMSVLTVGNHRKQICRKLGFHSTVEVASYAANLHVSRWKPDAPGWSLLSLMAAM